MNESVPLSSLISHLTCQLCSGYLIEATTIIECLHTFCKSCIVKYLEDENTNCPQCKILIHQSHPLSYIMIDRTMQDLVYRIVPGLQAREQKCIEEFYQTRNLPIPDTEAYTPKPLTEITNGVHEEETSDAPAKGVNCNFHRDDTQVSIKLEEADNLPQLDLKYLHCSVNTTIKTIKKYISQKLYGTMDKHNTLDLFCQKELMGKDHSLEFVLRTRWRTKDLPLLLEYRPRVEVM